MSDQIKNRVVGAVVLFALAIIFLPKIFDGEKQSQRREFVTIPKKPVHQTPDFSQVLVSDDEVSASQGAAKKLSSTTAGNAQSVTVAKKTTVNKIAHQPVPPKKTIKAQAWVIRMGSFGNPDNVNAFVAKLRKKGFTAFSVPVVPKVGQVNKVYVGPLLNKNTLIKLQPKLKRSFKESGVIEKYQPLQ